MYPIKQSTAIVVPFFAHDASGDAVTGVADGSWTTKRISKNGGGFAAMTVTISELENGWYSFTLSASHSDTLGIMTIVFNSSSSKQVNLQFRVHANLQDDIASSIAGLNDLSSAQVNAEVDTALADYDAPTKAELDSAQASIESDIAGLNDLSAAAVNAEVDTALSDYDPPTKAELDTAQSAIQSDISGLNDISPAQVNAEVVDALNVDTYAEPGQELPPATTSLVKKIGYLFKAWRNRSTQTATEYKLYNDDAATVDQKSAVSDDGATFNRGEVATGP